MGETMHYCLWPCIPLCGIQTKDLWLTFEPEKVTCEKCLERMGIQHETTTSTITS